MTRNRQTVTYLFESSMAQSNDSYDEVGSLFTADDMVHSVTESTALHEKADSEFTHHTGASVVEFNQRTAADNFKDAIIQQDQNDDNGFTTKIKADKGSKISVITDVYRKTKTENEHKMRKNYNGKMKTLLWYDTHNKSMVVFTTSLGFSKCKYKNCQYETFFSRTDTKPTKPFDADAILIQSAGIWDLSPPPRRDQDQVFVLGVRDAFPRTTAERDPGMGIEWVDLFNWTMTYRLDSDIVVKYGDIVEKEDKNEIANKKYDQIFDEKEDKAVWFVSHCRTRSMREHYVREIQNVIGVDIFGGCGSEPPCHKPHRKEIQFEVSQYDAMCFEEIVKQYKFYLAFENTLVQDYVTEKVYSWYSRDIILVVRGGSNYSKILPHGTFIDAGDFESAIELGHYLIELANDKQRYTDILRKKDAYYSTDSMVPTQEANCKLCEYLNNLDGHRNTYENIIEWWLKGWKNFDLKPSPLDGWPRNPVGRTW